ncbi:MAG: hypothetical protein ACE5HE_09925 [Phycisphaerae bacterium]
MTRLMGISLLSLVATSYASIAGARACDPVTDTPLPEARQARLLERFGDEGIDADEDGALTIREVRTFFEAKRADRPRIGHRPEVPWRHGPGKAMHRLGFELHHLAVLAAEAPPEDFDLTRHADVDTNGDGQISLDEWRVFATQKRGEIAARVAAEHPNADTDGDGTLNDAEIEALRERFRVGLSLMHPEADVNSDGVVSAQEQDAFHVASAEKHRGVIMERHPEADLNGDGVLSNAEMHSFFEAHHSGPAGRRGERHRGCGPGHRERLLEHHPEADTNGDGALSNDELHEFRASRSDTGLPPLKGRHGCKSGERPATER